MKRIPLPLRMPLLAGAVAMSAAASVPFDGLACGYHFSDVFQERVALNVVYPEAMHVAAAISTAQIEKRLPMPVSSAATPDLFAYQRTVKALERLGAQLVPDARLSSFSLVLIERMLWTRFDLGGGVKVQIHVPAPETDDLVVVSGEDVIAEIVNARMSINEARKLGLIRLYGSDAQIAGFLAAFKKRSSATHG